MKTRHHPQPSRVDLPAEDEELTAAALRMIVGGNADPDEPPPGMPKRPG